MKKKLELLAPAGSLATLKAVVNAGADAVYLGGELFGARAYANNFSKEELLEGIDYGHRNDCRVILAVNTLLKEKELKEQLFDYLLPYYEKGIDAVIVQDFGVMAWIKEQFPGLPIHTSTQMTVTGVEGAKFLASMGADRVVMARELSFSEIREIHEAVDVELEGFVHGALCYCYSGQCLFSSMLGGRSGNRGRCAQPCRLPYQVLNGAKKPLGRAENYILSPKDLCTIENIPKLAEAGIYSFKIEGRMKQAEYAAGVVSIYRKYMDRYLSYGATDYAVAKEDKKKLYDFGNRSGFTDGYYTKHNGKEMITFEKPNHTKSNDALQEQIRKQYIETEKKEQIKGKVFLQKGVPARMEVSLRELSVSVTGDVVQKAKNSPLKKENIYEKLNKTKSTPYEFESLEIIMEDDIFLPVQAINQLRRDVLTKLAREEAEAFVRKPVEKKLIEYSDNSENLPGETCLSVSVETKEAFFASVKRAFVKRIYLDSQIFGQKTSGKSEAEEMKELVKLAKEAGKEVYYIFPFVFRSSTKKRYEMFVEELKTVGFDGFLIKSYDEIGFCREHQISEEKLMLDHNMYTYTDFTRHSFASCGIKRDTAPLELNAKELMHRDNTDSEMILYGYLPLMVSAQCVHKNMQGCDKKRQISYLKDRYGKEFAVKNNCKDCYNVIYNVSPLSLMHQKKEILPMGFSWYRLCFTLETEKEAEHILDLYEKMWLQGKKKEEVSYLLDYTNGHFKRGVE